MKKILAVLLALALALAFAACGGQTDTAAEEEGLTAIPLGGSLNDFALEGDAFGVYTQIDFPEGTEPGEGYDAQLYYSEGSNTPYIAVYRWANEGGKTLEEETAALTKEYDLKYRMSDWDGFGTDEVGYYTAGYTRGENYYYMEGDILQDGDEFVEIDFFSATEEVALGDSGQYLWIPKGYTDMMNDEEAAHGAVFYAEYDDSFALPSIWIGKSDGSYAYEEWVWGDVYPDGLPVDEETYNGWMAQAEKDGWTDELNKEYYEAFGCTYYKNYTSEPADGIRISGNKVSRGENDLADIYITIGEDCYNVCMNSDAIFAHSYAPVLEKSLHSK